MDHRASRAEQNTVASRSDPAAASREHDHDPSVANQPSQDCIEDSALAAARSLRRHVGALRSRPPPAHRVCLKVSPPHCPTFASPLTTTFGNWF